MTAQTSNSISTQDIILAKSRAVNLRTALSNCPPPLRELISWQEAIGAVEILLQYLEAYAGGNQMTSQFNVDAVEQELGVILRFWNDVFRTDTERQTDEALRYFEMVFSMGTIFSLSEDDIKRSASSGKVHVGERAKIYRQILAEANHMQQFPATLEQFAPNIDSTTTRGEKLVEEIYTACGKVHVFCDIVRKLSAPIPLNLWEEAVQASMTVGGLLNILIQVHTDFIDKYLGFVTREELSALANRLENQATYTDFTPELFTRINQEIEPIRMALFRHTGEEAEKQKHIIANYDQMVDVALRDRDASRLKNHPVYWLVGILLLGVFQIFGTLPLWLAFCFAAIFIPPIVMIGWMDFVSFSQSYELEYADNPDYWATRTHLNDRMLETRKDTADKIRKHIDRKNQWVKRGEKIFLFGSLPIFVVLVILGYYILKI